MRLVVLLVAAFVIAPHTFGADPALSGHSAKLYEQAKSGKWFADAAKLKPEIAATSDSESFIVIWKPNKEPKRWIVSLHGSNGFATDDLALWHPHVKDRDVGLVCLQWWLGKDATPDYYTPKQVYHEIEIALQKLGVKPGTVMLHGFSRGSANSYAVAAMDAGRGQKYFSLCVASSGGVGLDYPATRAISKGEYGEHPLKGTRWITVAGKHDSHPDRDGIAGMKRTAEWLKEQDANIVESIEDPNEGHGALMRNPKNARRVMELFFNEKR